MSVEVVSAYQGLYVSTLKAPTHFLGPVQHSQSLLKWVRDTLDYQTNCFAIDIWISGDKFRHPGGCNLICAIN